MGYLDRQELLDKHHKGGVAGRDAGAPSFFFSGLNGFLWFRV